MGYCFWIARLLIGIEVESMQCVVNYDASIECIGKGMWCAIFCKTQAMDRPTAKRTLCLVSNEAGAALRQGERFEESARKPVLAPAGMSSPRRF